VRPGSEPLTPYFSCLGGPDAVFIKKRARTRYVELVFLHPVGFVGHVVHSSASGAQNVDALFFMLGWDRYDSTKSAQTHVMLHLRFCIWWNLWVTYCIPLHQGRETSRHYFSCSVGPGAVSIKKRPDTLR
jgi:hypothetical protein